MIRSPLGKILARLRAGSGNYHSWRQMARDFLHFDRRGELGMSADPFFGTGLPSCGFVFA
jgi:hypothetical protein